MYKNVTTIISVKKINSMLSLICLVKIVWSSSVNYPFGRWFALLHDDNDNDYDDDFYCILTMDKRHYGTVLVRGVWPDPSPSPGQSSWADHTHIDLPTARTNSMLHCWVDQLCMWLIVAIWTGRHGKRLSLATEPVPLDAAWKPGWDATGIVLHLTCCFHGPLVPILLTTLLCG